VAIRRSSGLRGPQVPGPPGRRLHHSAN